MKYSLPEVIKDKSENLNSTFIKEIWMLIKIWVLKKVEC